MPDLRDAFDELEKIYAQPPALPCVSCGTCCVTPHLTLVEFAYQLDSLLTLLSPEEISALMDAPMPEAEHLPGNYLCKLQNAENKCLSHPGRSLSCRLEGLPLMDLLANRITPICPHITDQDVASDVTAELISQWQDRLSALNAGFHTVMEEPYWLESLNLECWWAVALDPKITQPFFLQIRQHLADTFDLSLFAPHYVDTTDLSRKLNLIDAFFAANEQKNPDKAFKLIRQVMHDFPRTGTYYRREAQEYFKLMKIGRAHV